MTKKISRREFALKTLAVSAAVSLHPAMKTGGAYREYPSIRLGGPVFAAYRSPAEWAGELKKLAYRAALCPVDTSADQAELEEYKNVAAAEDIIIAEVGTWSNPISPNEQERKQAIEKCISGLRLADEIGAACCVNTSGSRNEEFWAGPHMDNLADETFDMVVESTRKIIDAVHPTRTWYTLEAMPWSFPYSADSYLKLLKAIDRERFAVHLDPVNMVVSPQVYFRNGEMIRDFFRKLGPHIKSCHAKDILLREDIYTPQLGELRPGLGKLDYNAFLRELSKLKDVPLIMEHLDTAEEYRLAAGYIRSVARANNIAC